MQRAEGRNTSADVSSIGLAKEECRGCNARRADHACARCSRSTLLGRHRGGAPTSWPFVTFGDTPVAGGVEKYFFPDVARCDYIRTCQSKNHMSVLE